ncbi:MAG: hypothetical protein JJ863_01445 [Deltaproteobacteria bacterium]|nr:hypothetical protein [Deltaproteobacteria bacterium]
MKWLSTRGFLTLAFAAAAAFPATAFAEPFEEPPAPDEVGPRRAGELLVDAVFPILRSPLCPLEAQCIFGGGGGVGATLEWRFPRGLAAGFGYDVSFLDGSGVWELSTMQMIRGTIRYYGLQERLIHPYAGASAGLLLLGDTFTVGGVGGGIDLFAGAEVEITSGLSFTGAFSVRTFVTNEFTTDADHVTRADSFGLNVAIMLRFGLVLVEGPG